MSIRVAISMGEFIDKLTILEIKSIRIDDPGKRANVKRELESLRTLWRNSEQQTAEIAKEMRQLKEVNAELWEIEDKIRAKEREQLFDEEFIELARAVYRRNDERARLKRTISVKLASSIVEEKSYAPY